MLLYHYYIWIIPIDTNKNCSMVPYYTVMDQRLGRSRTLQTCYYRKYTWLKLNNCRHEMLNKSRCHSDDVSSILMIIHQIKCISETVSSHVCNVDIKSHQVDLVRYVIPCVMRCLWFWYTKWQGLYLFQKKGWILNWLIIVLNYFHYFHFGCHKMG